MPSACLTDTFTKHFTHSLSFNECAVASVEVVSAGKEAFSAHVAISNMDVQNAGGQERRPRGERVPMSIFTNRQTRARAFPTLVVLIMLFTVFGEWALLSRVSVLYGTHRAHGERMECVLSAERTYWTDT